MLVAAGHVMKTTSTYMLIEFVSTCQESAISNSVAVLHGSACGMQRDLQQYLDKKRTSFP